MKKLIDVLGEPNKEASASRRAATNGLNIWMIITIVLLLIVIIGGLFLVVKPDLSKLTFWQKGKDAVSPLISKEEVSRSTYSAVFLTNNQVYFGIFKDRNSQYPKLADVYYLRVQRTVEPAELEQAQKVKVAGKEEEAGPIQPSIKNEMTLIKLGNEIHGPTDEISLNRDHILYIEDLKEDSKVVKAIKDFKNTN